MAYKGPHFVNSGGLPKGVGEKGVPAEVISEKNAFHDALLAVLERREITERNISILEENMGIVSLQSILDGVENEKRTIDTQVTEKQITKYVNDVKSRMIQTLQELGLGYALTQMKTITPDTAGDTREINVNSIMIGDLRSKI